MTRGQIRNIQCFSNLRNTGRDGCKFSPGAIIGHILVSPGWSMSVLPSDTDAALAATLIGIIEGNLNSDNATARFQFLGKYVGFENKSEAPTVEKKGYGMKKKVNRGVITHEYEHSNGQDYHNALLTYDGKEDQYKCLPFDAQGVVYAANQKDATGALIGLQGVELDSLYVYDREDANYESSAKFKLGMTYANNSELNEEMFAIATGVNLATICEENAVIDTELAVYTATGTRIFPFTVKTVSGGVNLGDTFGATLADTTAFVAANKTTGAAITISSVTYSAITKKYTITFATGGGYSAAAAALVGLAAPSVLDGLGISFYTSELIEITMN